MPLADRAPACPFVAFEDDRDERASVPDHRHRCYAEPRPAPRALAHQEAYCLSSAFPVCPTFQDWARREAARARGGSDRDASRPAAAAAHEATAERGLGIAAAAAAATASGRDLPVNDGDDDGPDDPHDDAVADGGDQPAATGGVAADADRDHGPLRDAEPADDVDDLDDPRDDPARVRRNPPRDWAAPPPWLASNERRRDAEDGESPSFLGRRAADPGQGLAGSAADRLAGGGDAVDDDTDSAAWVSSATARPARAEPPRRDRATLPMPQDEPGEEPPEEELRRVPRRGRAYAQHLGGPNAPDWEQPRRYEAYPTIRTRVGVPQVPRLALMAGAILVLAIALLVLPGMLLFGTSGGSAPAGGSASPSGRSPAPSVEPSTPAAPTPVIYTIKKGDTLSKVATRNGLTLDELLKANPDIKNPNKVSEGQQIIIPVPTDGEASGGASAAP